MNLQQYHKKQDIYAENSQLTYLKVNFSLPLWMLWCVQGLVFIEGWWLPARAICGSKCFAQFCENGVLCESRGLSVTLPYRRGRWRGAAEVILARFQGGSDESPRGKPLTNPTATLSCCVNVSPNVTSLKICAVFPIGAFTDAHMRSPPSVLWLIWSTSRMYERSYPRLRHVVHVTCVNLYSAWQPWWAASEKVSKVTYWYIFCIYGFLKYKHFKWYFFVI